MNKYITAIILVVVTMTVSSCSILNGKLETVKAEKTTETKPKRDKAVFKPASIGEQVVARWGPALWAEGKVASVNETTKEATIAWADGSSPNAVDIADVYPLPSSGAGISVQPGDYTLVKSSTDEWWNAAEVKEVTDTVVKAKIINGGEIVNVSAEKVLNVSDAVAADIKDTADRQKFLDSAHEHRPVAPVNYTPSVGEHVLGEWTSNAWYGGKVKSVSDGKALIVWENGMSPDKAALEKVVPFPTATNGIKTPAVGNYVLLKPTGGNPKASWVYGQITTIGPDKIEAKSMDFGTREYVAGEFVVLER